LLDLQLQPPTYIKMPAAVQQSIYSIYIYWVDTILLKMTLIITSRHLAPLCRTCCTLHPQWLLPPPKQT